MIHCINLFFSTFQALEMGAVETLIVWENLETQRITLKNHAAEGLNVFTTFLNSIIPLERRSVGDDTYILKF